MVDVRVHTTVRYLRREKGVEVLIGLPEIVRAYKTEQVQAAVTIIGSLERVKDFVAFVELTLLDRLIDTNNILPYDATCTDVQVAGE